MERVYTRAQELCQQVGETPQLFTVLRGLWRFYILRAELKAAHEMAEQLMSLARNVQKPALLLEGHRVLGGTLLYSGEIASSQTHLDQSISGLPP